MTPLNILEVKQMARRPKGSNSDGVGCLVFALLVIFLMPIVGLFMVCGKDPEKKGLGWVLLIVGTILWIWLACS